MIKKIRKIVANSISCQIIFFILTMVFLFVGYFKVKTSLQRIFEIVADDFSWVYQIDDMICTDEQLEITGWAFQVGQDSVTKNCEIVFLDIKTGKRLYPEMRYEDRKDVNDYFICEYNYLESGFKAAISIESLDMKETAYEVILRPTNADEAYHTGIYIFDESITYTNPYDFTMPNVKGTDLEKVVEEGILRVYNEEFGRYVYQYDGELYWIADEQIEPIEDNLCMQFQLTTTQEGNLPEERIKKNWLWDNLSFYFETNEITDWNTGQYRVAKEKLPTEYSIVKIWTGDYIKDWKWICNFRPWYELTKK